MSLPRQDDRMDPDTGGPISLDPYIQNRSEFVRGHMHCIRVLQLTPLEKAMD